MRHFGGRPQKLSLSTVNISPLLPMKICCPMPQKEYRPDGKDLSPRR